MKAFMILVLSFWTSLGIAQETKVDINDLVDETQKTAEGIDKIDLVWWIPNEYWNAVFADDPTMSESQIEEIISVLDRYVVIVAVSGKMGAFGGITYVDKSVVRENISITVGYEKWYLPLPEESIDADTKNFMTMMKPVFANMLGSLGENMHLFLFPAKNENNRFLINPLQEGNFAVKLMDETYNWRLPLGSLLPKKVCKTCGESLNGAWKFCPWDGTKLTMPEEN